MTILVTGATGHIGLNLVRALLEDGRRVRALVHQHGERLFGLEVERIRGDVLDPSSLRRAMEGVEIVYHLAALVSILQRDATAVARLNVVGPRNVVAACLDAKVKRLVHFSSIHALSHLPIDGRVDEARALTTDAEGAPPYDRSKAAGEREIQAGVARGLDAVVVNPTGVVGPWDYRPSAMGTALLDMRRRALPAMIGGGFNFVDARDVARGALAAEARGRTGHRYLLAGNWHSVRDIAGIVERISGARPPRFTCPMWVARAAAPLVEAIADARGAEATFTRASLHALRNHRIISTEKAESELGYRTRPFESTVRDTFAWFDELAQPKAEQAEQSEKTEKTEKKGSAA
jgi:dihydroflavonol-4-reductase